MAEIPVHGRRGIVAHALVDDDDYARLAAFRWHLNKGYVARTASNPRRTVRMHREVCGLGPGDPREPDHIDGNPLDNRRHNLRVGSHADNGRNRPNGANRGARSTFRGVCWNRQRQRWQATVRVDGRLHHAGWFTDEAQAGRAAARARAELFGGVAK